MSARLLALIAAASSAAILAGCVSDGGAASAEAAKAKAAARGLAYAREACASCHAVEPGQASSPNPASPSFDSLAGRPDMTRPALSALLRSPHRNMPALIVEPDRIDDLAAYLAELGA
ncbi:MAG: c-type cytochrome [Parvularculaceae bacterium]